MGSQTVFMRIACSIFKYPTDFAQTFFFLNLRRVANRSAISRSKGFPKIDSREAVRYINWQFAWSYEISSQDVDRMFCFFFACFLVWKATSCTSSGKKGLVSPCLPLSPIASHCPPTRVPVLDGVSGVSSCLTCLPSCFPVLDGEPPFPRACLPPCFPSCLPACLPTCFSSCFSLWRVVWFCIFPKQCTVKTC